MINQYSSDFCELKAERFWYLATDAASVEITAYGIIDVLVWNMNRKASWFSSAVSPHEALFSQDQFYKETSGYLKMSP